VIDSTLRREVSVYTEASTFDLYCVLEACWHRPRTRVLLFFFLLI